MLQVVVGVVLTALLGGLLVPTIKTHLDRESTATANNVREGALTREQRQGIPAGTKTGHAGSWLSWTSSADGVGRLVASCLQLV